MQAPSSNGFEFVSPLPRTRTSHHAVNEEDRFLILFGKCTE
jgi:hypothetical protein